MSEIGFEVPAKTADEIRQAAADARCRLRLSSGRIALVDEHLEDLLFKHVAPGYNIDIDIRADHDPELRYAHAAYRPRDRVMLLRDSVLRQAKAGDKEAHFTIFHEIGHVHMHSEVVHFRKMEGRSTARNSNSEWQADWFAVEFAIDRQELIDHYGDNLTWAANYYKLPFPRLHGFVEELRKKGVFKQQKKNDIERYLDAVQSDFDF